MPKFLVKASYSPEGARGLAKEGATSRRATVQKLIKSVGGKMESFYFAYGDADALVIADLPDASTAVALSLAINMSGVVKAQTVPLITVEEMDEACAKSIPYKAPGA